MGIFILSLPRKINLSMKKIIFYFLLMIVIAIAVAVYLFILPATNFSESKKTFIIEEYKNNEADITNTLTNKYIIKNSWAFSILANQLKVFNRVKPGKFEVSNGTSMLNIVRMLRNNKQAEIKLTINKIRTRDDVAQLLAKNFAITSSDANQFFSNNDSLQPFGVDSNTLQTLLIPNTYSFYYYTNLPKMLAKLKAAKEDFWSNNDRLSKAKIMGFSPEEIYTIASIVEEETNMEADKGKIASVYINRFKKGMALGADPTIKYALNNFELKRILFVHLQVQSPYNTYKNKGLPPGPICTPSTKTIDAVLNAPTTDYIFFVAKADFSGYSNFSNNFEQHKLYAKEYQYALDQYLENKKE